MTDGTVGFITLIAESILYAPTGGFESGFH